MTRASTIRPILVGLLAVLGLTLAATVGAAGSGSLDPSFGGGGWSSAGFPTAADGVAVQPDGKIVLVGPTTGQDFGIARITADGVYDGSFGSGGQVSVHFNLGRAGASSVALQPDGKIVVAGDYNDNETHSWHMALARLNPDGSLDTAFGDGGREVPEFSGTSESHGFAIALAPGGKIVVAGYVVYEGASSSQFVAARFDSNGQLDTSFGGLGWSSAGFPPSANAVVVQPDGKVLVASGAAGHFAIARITADGVYDDSFGSGGQVAVQFPTASAGESDVVEALALQKDGKIVAAGIRGLGASSSELGLARLNPDGSPDLTFGANGTADWAGYGQESAVALAVRDDGMIFVGGSQDRGDFALWMFAPPHFGTKLTYDFGGSESVDSIALQPDGKIVLGGYTSRGGSNFLVARVIGPPTQSASPPPPAPPPPPTPPPPPPPPPAPPPPASPLSARILTTTIVENPAGRELVMRLRVSEKARAALRITGRGATLVDRRGWVLPGTNRLGVQIPASAGKGKYDVAIGLAASARHRLTLHGGVLVPALTRRAAPCQAMATCVYENVEAARSGYNDGTGRVTSSPAGIDCQFVDGQTDPLTVCSAYIRSLTDDRLQAVLTSAPAPGSDVECEATTRDTPCRQTLDLGGIHCPAPCDGWVALEEFQLKRFSLKVSRNGLGTGTVVGRGTSSASTWRGSVNCVKACAVSKVPYGASFRLTAKPRSGSVFLHWTGACTGQRQACKLTITQDTETAATFVRPPSPKP